MISTVTVTATTISTASVPIRAPAMTPPPTAPSRLLPFPLGVGTGVVITEAEKLLGSITELRTLAKIGVILGEKTELLCMTETTVLEGCVVNETVGCGDVDGVTEGGLVERVRELAVEGNCRIDGTEDGMVDRMTLELGHTAARKACNVTDEKVFVHLSLIS